MKGILLTNNPAAAGEYEGKMETMYLEGACLIDVLCLARNKVHTGHKLLTHPLSGSVKPGQTPYKSLIISKEKGNLDLDSLKIIEDSIAIANKQAETPVNNKELKKDYQLIDLSLIESATN